MKNIKFLLTIPSFFVLIACPSHHFFEYKYIGNSMNSKFSIDNKILNIGFLNQFIEEKEKGLVVIANKKIENDILEINSSKFGVINKTLPINGLYQYNKDSIVVFVNKFKSKNESKILEDLKNDTIIVKFKSGENYYFVKE